MATGLRQIIGRQKDARQLLAVVSEALGVPVSVEDAEGALLHGAALTGDGVGRFPVTLDGTHLGWVCGPAPAQAVAALLDHLVARESEKKALGAEVLHLYREINLIYSFSEKLAALLDLDRVAQLTLEQARQLIAGTDGAIALLDEDTGLLAPIAGFGEVWSRVGRFVRGQGIIGAIAATGIGEIVNDIDADPRTVLPHGAVRSLLVAPLKVGERVIGVIGLGSTTPATYSAADLKLLTTLALQTATAIENARLFERTVQAAHERERLMALHKEAELARAKLEGELKLAARIQADLFPADLPRVDGYEFAARNRPARKCGGDYYDALPLTRAGGGGLLLCVADVSGKGLPAALVMSNMQATLRALIGRTDSLAELAGHASELLYAATPPEKYVTAAFVELAPATGWLTFVGAGHLDNLVLRASGATVPLVSTGTPLGLLPLAEPYGEAIDRLHPGDTLVLFSDGVTEAQNAADEEFGEERLAAILRGASGLPVAALIDRVFAAIDEFAGAAPQFDDITMLVVRRRKT